MALDPVPWFVGGGAEHSPSVARTLSYIAAGGQTGVAAPDDLKVSALPTPGGAVRIATGAATLVSRYPGAPGQAYAVRNPTPTDVEVGATGSSGGATKFVIVRILDPQYAGSAPADPRVGPYTDARIVWSVADLDYPFILLAKINQPANTSTITNAMIEDRRELVNPKSRRRLYLTKVASGHNLTSTDWTNFPNVKESVEVPDWCTYANITATLSGMQHITGPVAAEFLLRVGSTDGRTTAVDAPGAPSGYARVQGMTLTWESKIRALAGQTVDLQLRARKLSGAGALRADNYTHITFDVEFLQDPS